MFLHTLGTNRVKSTTVMAHLGQAIVLTVRGGISPYLGYV